MGRTNRMLSKIADIVAVTFPRTKYALKTIYTGIPLRRKKKFQILKLKRKGYLLLEEAKGKIFF